MRVKELVALLLQLDQEDELRIWADGCGWDIQRVISNPTHGVALDSDGHELPPDWKEIK